MRRVISFVFKFCLAVTALYYIGLNALLASPLADTLMTIAPEITQIHYSRAYSLIPFHIEVDDFRLSVQDPSMQMYVSADHASGDIYPWTILLQHKFFAKHLRGEGVVFRMRQRQDPKVVTPAQLALEPVIPGYADITKDGKGFPEGVKPLGVELVDLDVKNLHQVWVDEFQFDGHIDVLGGFSMKAFEYLSLDPTTLSHISGRLLRGSKAVATVHSMKVDAELEEISLAKIDPADMLDSVTASLSLDATIDSAQFLNAYLRRVPDVRLEEGGGKLTLDLKLVKGTFDDQSKLALDTSKVVVQLPYFDVLGKAAIRWQVTKGTSFFTVKVPELTAIERKDSRKAFTGKGFELAASTTADLSKMANVTLDVSLDRGVANDLTFLNGFIPEGTGLHIASGGGVVSGKIAVSTKTRHAKGVLDIEGNQLSVKNRSATLTGHAKVHGEIVDLNIDSGAMDLSGSSIALNDIGVWADGDVHRNFALKVVADPCVMSPKGATKWSAKLAMTISNLQPVLSIVSANAPLPGILKPFADVPNVRVSTELTVHAKDIEVRKIRVDSSKLQVDGDLKLAESGETGTPDAKLYPWGAMLVKLHGLEVGIDMQGSMVRPIIGDPEGWFAKYLTEHPVPNKTATATAL